MQHLPRNNRLKFRVSFFSLISLGFEVLVVQNKQFKAIIVVMIQKTIVGGLLIFF